MHVENDCDDAGRAAATGEPGDGVLIEGSAEELEGLVETIRSALEDGEAEGFLLGDDGVEPVRVRLVD